jgi:hypothetical protein
LQKPYAPKDFSIYYDFDVTVNGRHAGLLSQIVDYAEKTEAKRVIVTSLRGATLLSDGTVLREQPSIAQARAEEMVDLLMRAGILKTIIQITAPSEPEPADGVNDWQTRRTTVRVEP